MPVPLRTPYHRAEAKYNVTTEFPSLGLHSAAATGNLGLVEYALDHGQPINSVLDGVLPLHAACAGGSEQVVKLLIEHGADVNAPRLPRRYSNDKNRDTSAPIVGTSGSTPLHFAAANGNTAVVHTLLLHGAHADRPDKHGITPEMLATQHGWVECATVLHNWLLNKDKDLREREYSSGRYHSSIIAEIEPSTPPPPRRRIHMKQSIDTALNMLKSSSTGLSDAYLKAAHHRASSSNLKAGVSTPPASPTTHKPLGEYTFYPTDDGRQSPYPPGMDPNSRRPSLPQIYTPSSSRNRKVSAPQTISQNTRRPRSAGGDDGEGEEDPNFSRPPGRRLGTKYSLLNIFKKAQTSDAVPTTVVPHEGLPTSASVPIPIPSSAAPPPPLFGTSPHSASPKIPSPIANLSSSNLNEKSGICSHSPSSSSGSPFSRGFRFHRGSDASTRSRNPTPQSKFTTTSAHSPTRPQIPLAVDLHNAMAAQQQQQSMHTHVMRDRSRSSSSNCRFFDNNSFGTDADGATNMAVSGSLPNNSSPLSRLGLLRGAGHQRDRSGSGGSLGGARPKPIFDDVVPIIAGGVVDSGKGSSPRPGILRAYNRNNPFHGQGQVQQQQQQQSPPNPNPPHATSRSLRFDSSSGGGARREPDVHAGGPLRSSNSAGSLVRSKRGGEATAGDLGDDLARVPEHIPPSYGRKEANVDYEDEDELEDDYGQPIEYGPVGGDEALSALMSEDGGLKSSSSRSSLSPIDNAVAADGSGTLIADFPFSINHPPQDGSHQLLRVPMKGDNRGRGDSLSSTSTNDSENNPQLSASGTTSGSGGSVTITTPLLLPIQDTLVRDAGDEMKADAVAMDLGSQSGTNSPGGFNGRRIRTPLDIDISTISSHAQAEALVQRTQQDILEIAQQVERGLSTGNSTGRSPLSARLAAYGESLEIERRLREQQNKAKEEAQVKGVDTKESRSSRKTQNVNGTSEHNDGGVRVKDQHRAADKGAKPRAKEPKRPSTADGLASRGANTSFGSEHTTHTHHSSHSASGFHHTSPASGVFEDRDYPAEHSYLHAPPLTRTHRSQDPLTQNRDRDRDRAVPITIVAADDGQLSRISSLDDSDLGLALVRTATAPNNGVGVPLTNTTSTTRDKRDRARSANKLTRMGFQPADLTGRSTPTPLASGSRFGAIKSFFKGK